MFVKNQKEDHLIIYITIRWLPLQTRQIQILQSSLIHGYIQIDHSIQAFIKLLSFAVFMFLNSITVYKHAFSCFNFKKKKYPQKGFTKVYYNLIKSMKLSILLTMIVLFMLITNSVTLSLSRPVPKEVQVEPALSIQSFDFSNTTSIESHKVAPVVVGAVIAGAQLLLDLVKTVAAAFEVTCKNGYKRGNAISVLNKLTQSIYVDNTYFDSGKLLLPGNSQLSQNQISTYQMSKKAGGATGSCGITSWRIDDTYDMVIFFQNPWSAYNMAAVCILPIYSYGSSSQIFWAIYKKKYSADNCIYFDNSNNQDYFYPKPVSRQIRGYTLSVYDKYEYTDGCYIQEIDIVISP